MNVRSCHHGPVDGRPDGTLLAIFDHQLEIQGRGRGEARDYEAGAEISNDHYLSCESSAHANTIRMTHWINCSVMMRVQHRVTLLCS